MEILKKAARHRFEMVFFGFAILAVLTGVDIVSPISIWLDKITYVAFALSLALLIPAVPRQRFFWYTTRVVAVLLLLLYTGIQLFLPFHWALQIPLMSALMLLSVLTCGYVFNTLITETENWMLDQGLSPVGTRLRSFLNGLTSRPYLGFAVVTFVLKYGTYAAIAVLLWQHWHQSQGEVAYLFTPRQDTLTATWRLIALAPTLMIGISLLFAEKSWRRT